MVIGYWRVCATSHQTPTRIGDRNFLMCNCHVAHDCLVGNNCSFANGVLLAGHVRVDDRAVIGGNTTIHQHARVGRGSMCSGAVGITSTSAALTISSSTTIDFIVFDSALSRFGW